MSAFNNREEYKSDQGIPLTGLALLLVGTPLAAAAVAWGLKFLFFHEWYLLFLVPAFGGLLLGAGLFLLIGWAHCRNYWLAGGLGVLGGLVAYLGYYHLCLLEFLPPGNVARLDLLPRYIIFRMHTDVAEDVGQPRVNNQPKEPVAGLNWYTFVFELAMMTSFPAGIAWARARRAYCLDLKQWMQQETAQFAPFSGQPLKAAFESGQLADFVAKNPAGGNPQAACRLILEYAQPADESPLSQPIYASIKDVPRHKPFFWWRRIPRTHVRQAALSTAEVLTLRPLFPGLARLLQTQHAELRDLPANVLPPPADVTGTDDVAVITPVPEPYRQRVRRPGYTLKVNLIGLTPLVFIFAGLGLLFLGGRFISRDEILLSLAPFLVGASCCVWGVYTGAFCMSVYENRWIERRLRADFAQRPDFLVDPADADAVYVSLIPRENFTHVKLTMASDLLLMRIDSLRREVLLEGDCDRYRVPSGAIATCEPQCFFHPIDVKHQNELWMVRLMIEVEHGLRELLLSVAQTGWRPRTNTSRQAIAHETCRKINGLRKNSLDG